MQIDQLWSKTDAVFRSDVSDDVADIWLSQLTPAALDGDTLYLTGTDRARGWVELRYGRVLNRCVAKANAKLLMANPTKLQASVDNTAKKFVEIERIFQV